MKIEVWSSDPYRPFRRTAVTNGGVNNAHDPERQL